MSNDTTACGEVQPQGCVSVTAMAAADDTPDYSSDEATGQRPRPGISRIVELDVAPDRLWELVSTAEGWERWLVDATAIALQAGANGTVTDHGVRRGVRIGEVVEGRSVAFTWWEPDDPWSLSTVLLEVQPEGEGSARLLITEEFAGPVSLAAASRSNVQRIAWEVRVCSLWACTVAMALV
jgi:uncharacterized protein YndB with AHSA1/START domain